MVVIIDIGKWNKYPFNLLSNFAPHTFIIDGIICASMEGFLQSLKFRDINLQKYVCTLVGLEAKTKGKYKTWYKTQTLYWRGVPYKRSSKAYQNLLDRAYYELSKNNDFKNALLATGDANLIHSIGHNNATQTILTENEFCSRLMKLRDKIKNNYEAF